MRYQFFADREHAWLEVQLQELELLGVADQVSEYSYLNKGAGVAYLEEDADAPLFISAYCKAYDVEPREFWARVQQVTEDVSFVRGLGRYNEGIVYRSMGRSVGA